MIEVWRELAFACAAAGLLAVLADGFARPRAAPLPVLRSLSGTTILVLAALFALACVLILTGSPALSAVVVVTLSGGLSLISNIKRRVLGEPLVFSDFALIGAVFQHPQFYLTALHRMQIVVLAVGLAGLAAALALLSNLDPAPRTAGLAVGLGSGLGLALLLQRSGRPDTETVPNPEADVLRHGLVASLLAHWHAWRGTLDPEPCSTAPISGRSGQLVVVVQCESFTDPVALLGDPELTLPGLEAARAAAWQHGRLLVSGFGAYTMRTEFGVLFGRGEEVLGARRFDPFLTAHGETSWALPNRLDRREWDSWFVHPHDMRFYGRDRIMPLAGFGKLVGEPAFAPPKVDEGRYVTDAAVGDRILALAREGTRAGLIYAVTIENHGPWPPDEGEAARSAAPYLRLLARSDAMLAQLLDDLPRLGRPVLLCFFGDHRPSIPSASEPGAERHTPYVLVRFTADGLPILGEGEACDLTPAELHHAILGAIRLGEAQG